jgi:hypothetical protein
VHLEFFPVALHSEINGFTLAIPQILNNQWVVIIGLAIHPDNHVAGFQTRLTRRLALFRLVNHQRNIWIPPGHTRSLLAFGMRSQAHVEGLATAVNRERDGVFCARKDLKPDVLPLGVPDAIELNDPVARLEPCLRCCRIRFNGANYNGLVLVSRLLEVEHVKPGEHRHRQDKIHHWAHQDNHKSLPAWTAEKLARIASQDRSGIVARHLDISAKGQNAHPVIGPTSLKSENAFAETQRKGQDAHAKAFCSQEVASLVDEDHDSQDDDDDNRVSEET